jgi:membrane-associated protease RseP (regulator of RpoE activity)
MGGALSMQNPQQYYQEPETTKPVPKGHIDALFTQEGKMGIRWGAESACVHAVTVNSHASRLGVAAGDILVSVNDTPVPPNVSLEQFQVLLTGLKRPTKLRFRTTKRTVASFDDLKTMSGKNLKGLSAARQANIQANISSHQADNLVVENLSPGVGYRSLNTDRVAGTRISPLSPKRKFQSPKVRCFFPCLFASCVNHYIHCICI